MQNLRSDPHKGEVNFPTRMGGSGQGFAYNFGCGIGALMALLLPETRGLELTPD